MRRSRGFTMIELLIALVVMGVVMSAAVRFFRAMNVSVGKTSDRLDTMQNLRYAVQTLDRELRVAGAGTTEVQPTLVYISSTEVVFNGDLVSRIPNSPTAVYYNPDADPNASDEIDYANRFTIPTTAITYPDTTYRTTGSELSPAETVTYYFVADATTSRTDDYVLMRQVNNSPPDVVARNLLPYPGHSFFEWLRTDTLGNLVQVSTTALAPYPALPWRHQAPIHGSLADTNAMGAYIDSIRAVRVYIKATNGKSGTAEILRQMTTTVRIPNAGLTKQRSCGDAPIFGKTVTATFTGTASAPVVHLAWTPGTDESSGEKDIERYMIYRRFLAGSFDDALQSVPAGLASYTYDDPTVLGDSTYVYGVTAIDCTPLESTQSLTASITIPHHP
ncbi:MAG: prepilin-type N-terminal cleavage/methylation domain-containing protein [Gemmatimonadales bacterium]